MLSRRRLKYELRKAEARVHLLLGDLVALDPLDAVTSRHRSLLLTWNAAREGLMKEVELSKIQAQADSLTFARARSRLSERLRPQVMSRATPVEWIG